VKVILLGTAAGGGSPQWNCACGICTGGFLPRTQDCLAVSATGDAWYLVNASPDLRAQILATRELAAGPGPRQTPIRGALLTDAELDHTLGLTMLREAAGLHVWAPEAVLKALDSDFPLRTIVARYGGWTWELVPEELDGLRITVLPVSAKRPKYVSSEVDGHWVVAYRVDDPGTGGSLVYAPCLAQWPAGFDDMVSGAGCVILDGTFYSPREMSAATRTGIDPAAQKAMGHIPIAGDNGTLAHIRAHPGTRWIYTHLNNTNPILDPSSVEHANVRAAGVEVAVDGMRLDL
jgi:pyrroloquinoline quinone biosynthesis protein B